MLPPTNACSALFLEREAQPTSTPTMEATFREQDLTFRHSTSSWRRHQPKQLSPPTSLPIEYTGMLHLKVGGFWEAAVKSAKTHIKRVVGTELLNFEELSTVAAQVEACLNSRPLIATTSHSQDGVEVLTPAHFLIGCPICAYPEIPTTTELSLHKHWCLCQSIITHFWRCWSSEYLQQL